MISVAARIAAAERRAAFMAEAIKVIAAHGVEGATTRLIADFISTAVELVTWATRRHNAQAISIYDKALKTARSALEHASADRPLDPGDVDQIAYVGLVLAGGFALNSLTYGDRSAAAEQVDLTASVLDAWMATRFR
jgi:hypothetical protein